MVLVIRKIVMNDQITFLLFDMITFFIICLLLRLNRCGFPGVGHAEIGKLGILYP